MIRNNGLGYASPINFSEKNYFHVTFDRFCKKINASDHVTYILLFLLFFRQKCIVNLTLASFSCKSDYEISTFEVMLSNLCVVILMQTTRSSS